MKACAISTTANTSGCSTGEVRSRLQDGESLCDVAGSHGVSRGDLTDRISENLQRSCGPGTDTREAASRLADSPGCQPGRDSSPSSDCRTPEPTSSHEDGGCGGSSTPPPSSPPEGCHTYYPPPILWGHGGGSGCGSPTPPPPPPPVDPGTGVPLPT
jgi:hypothetical protein